MKAVAILGSTGSVGVTTLDVVERFRDRFRVVAMAVVPAQNFVHMTGLGGRANCNAQCSRC